MALFNITMARSLPTETTLSYYCASQELMNLLTRNRFAEMDQSGNDALRKIAGRYTKGHVYYFLKEPVAAFAWLRDS